MYRRSNYSADNFSHQGDGYAPQSQITNSKAAHHELDGVEFQLSDKYRIITEKITLPLNYEDRKLSLENMKYDFSLEKKVLENTAS